MEDSSTLKNRPEDKKEWHKQQEKILKEWGEVGASYRYMHDRAYINYNSQNLRFALPVIIISTVTGTANFAQSSFPASWQPYVPLGIGFLNLTAGLITTIAQFLRVSELLEGHRAASIAYSKFSRNISVELSLPYSQRTCGGLEFINKCRSELDRLIEQSPNIPLSIVKQFGAKFKDYTFIKPQILEITGVDVYKENSEEIAKREQDALERFNKSKDAIIDEENKRRMSIISELEREKQIKSVELKEMLELKKIKKKKDVVINNITTNMSEFISRLTEKDATNSILTPESSNSSEQSEETENIIIDVKERLHETKKKLLPIDVEKDDTNL
uniref:SLATT domain-containing protein n=1 Tax=viral metagenome TaxID=1070528 RepID=A0A6C0C718_9ZZZZ